MSQIAGSESPKSSDSPSESPPQQHSPPHPTSVGRAALRGTVHPLPGTNIGGLISAMERTTLQEEAAAAAPVPRREYEQIEQVFVTRPSNCKEKIGIFKYDSFK